MNSDRNTPTAAFWVTVALVAVLVAYPLSFGPACWIVSHFQNQITVPIFETLYQPILLLCAIGPSKVSQAIVWYASLGSDGTFIVNAGDTFFVL